MSASPGPAIPEAPARPSRRLWAGVGAFSVVLAAAGYLVLGNPGAWNVKPGDTAAAAPPSDVEVDAMLGQLAARLKKEPDNAQGWAMLGRSYLMLGRHAEAVGALEKLVALRPDDAQAIADLADAKAMAAGRNLSGEPEKLIGRALEIDPRNLKALALAGTIAFERGDYPLAVRHWESAVVVAGGEGELVANLRSGIAEARQRAGLPEPAGSTGGGGGTAAGAVAGPGMQVSGRVVLAAALAGQAAPTDTVFIFARPAEGSRMPLALLRAQVKDLPLEFTLDDSLAMNPAAKLSAAKRVVIGARISKSGQAMPQPGDLQGFSAPVDVGAQGVAIEIAEKVAKP
jgi:cytochrome c-type biogenesis protein CcmH